MTDAFRWPGSRRIAIVFNLAYEAWSDGKAPGIGPMGNVLQPGFFDTNAHSWATFGAVRGIDRLLGIVDRQGIKSSVMVNGVLAERHPESVQRIHERGHEIVPHSWGMDVIPVYLDEAAERTNLRRTREALAKASGWTSIGWISPRGTGSTLTPRLLAQEGFLWHGDCNDDDVPYVLDFDGRRIVGIPLTMDLNDLPLCVRYGQPPRMMIDMFDDTIRALRDRESRSLMIDVTAHAHVFGRAAGAWVYETIIERAKAMPDVWIATRQEIARHVLASV
ncbi:MAG: polysaccharide deacetylase family protein [Burkholderiales bacterium]